MKRKTFQTTGIRWIAAAGLAFGTLTAQVQAAPDLDGDGIPNIVDIDIDNDGIPNALDDNIDGGIATSGPFVRKYVGDDLSNNNPAEKDMDDDGQADDSLGETDIDGDSKSDDHPTEDDIDGDRRKDDEPDELDADGDGRDDNDASEDDIDGDSLDDDDLMEDDIDGDDRSDSTDDDIDGDSLGNSNSIDDDSDGDGRANIDDDDSDGDEIANRDDSDDDNDGHSDEDDLDHHGDDDELEVELHLTATEDAPSGSTVLTKVQRLATGKITLEFDARDLAVGTYDILVNDQIIGPIQMVVDNNRTEGEAWFETNPNQASELALPFDPIGLPVSIVKNGITYFTGIVPTPAEGGGGGGGGDGGGDDNGTGSSIGVALIKAPGLSEEAEGNAEVQMGLAGVAGLEVQVEAIPAGNYDLFVGGTLRGSLTVSLVEDKTQGVLRFRVVPDGPGELLLDFAVASQPIILSQNGITFFTGTAPGGE